MAALATLKDRAENRVRSSTGSAWWAERNKNDAPRIDRRHEAADDPSARPAPGRSFGDAEHQRRQRRAHEHHARVVGRGPGPRRTWSRCSTRRPTSQATQPDRQVDEEGPAPSARGDQGGTERRAGGDGQGARSLPTGRRPGTGARSGRHRAGAPARTAAWPPRRSPGSAGRPPAGHRRGQPAQRRTQAEDGQPGEEHPPAAEAVGACGPATTAGSRTRCCSR